MKVELHLHTTRYSGCAVATGGELMERMVEIGYEAVFITEHDAVWSDGEGGYSMPGKNSESGETGI